MKLKFKLSLCLIIVVLMIYNPISARIFTWNIARTHQIETIIFYRLIKTESSFRSLAISQQKAIGLGQLKVSTFKFMQPNLPKFMVWFPPANLVASAKYLQYLLKKFHNNWSVILAAYNWGESNVDKHLQNKSIVPHKDYREEFRNIPETYAFIKNVLGDAHE